MDNALLSCSAKHLQFTHPGDGSISPHEYTFVRGAGIAQDDPRLERFDATPLSPVNVSIGTRAVGAICHGLETFQAINSQRHLRKEDALLLGRACALTVTEETTRVLVDLKSDISNEIRSILSVALKTTMDFIKEISDYARNQDLRIGILEMVRAAFLRNRTHRSDLKPVPTTKVDDSFSWNDYRKAGATLKGTQSLEFEEGQGDRAEGSTAAASATDRGLAEHKTSEQAKVDDTRKEAERRSKSSDAKEERDTEDGDFLAITTEAIETLLRSLVDLKSKIEVVGNATPKDVIDSMVHGSAGRKNVASEIG